MHTGKIKGSLRKKGMLIGSLAAVSVGGLTAKQFYEYAAPPVGPKNCEFAYPEQAMQFNGTSITVKYPRSLPFTQTGGFINDASCLNRTQVYAIVKVRNEEDVKNALLFAKEQKLKVSIAGQQHTMGGQTFVPNGLVLDMKGLNKVSVDAEKKILTVQSGAVWRDVQRKLDALGLAMKAMQSINIFTVGGTLSVNAHGIAHNIGQVAPTVRSVKVMMHDGRIVTASRTENMELFRHVLGGYGLFGVILEAQIDVMSNEMYAQEDELMDYTDFPTYFENTISDNDAYGLFYARLSVDPRSFLTEVASHAFRRVEGFTEPLPVLKPEGNMWLKRFVINFSKTGPLGRSLRWMLEKYVDPKIRPCYESRNQLISKPEDCIIVRNQAMFDSMQYLQNRLRDTDILQEYFIPKDKFTEFVDGVRSTVQGNNTNLLNVTIRIVHKDTDTAMPYAMEEEMFAFVLYFNQKLNAEDSKVLEKTTQDLIALAKGMGGKFYLPYQLYYTKDTLQSVYPETDVFFETKRRFDPEEMFSNKFYEKYGSNKVH